MVPHIATEEATNSEMTNSEMELGNGQQLEDEMIHVENGVVFGSQLIDQNSATPYSDATKVRVPHIIFTLVDSLSLTIISWV